MSPDASAWVLVAVTAVILGADVLLATDSIPGNTWSEVVRYWARRYLVIPFAVGVVCGHWFWPL